MTLPSPGTRSSPARLFLSLADSGVFPSSPMQSALAIRDANEGSLRAIAETSGVIFRGYTGRYRYAQAGGSEFSVFEDGFERGGAEGAAFTADIQLYARFSHPFEGVPGHA